MRTRPCGIRGGIALLLGLVVVYPFVPGETVRGFWYDAVGALSVGHAWLGVRHHRAAHPRAWLLVIGGFLGWVLGDVVSTLETSTWHLALYPVPSDAVYLMSYVTLGAGLLALVRGKRTRRDLSVVLDAAIISTGTAVLVGVFVVAPIAADSTLSLLGKLVSSAYPLADVAMIGILVRLWVTPGARSSACRLLTSALAVTLLADVVWNTAVVSSGVSSSSVWNDVAWLLGYVLLAAACWSPSIRDVAPPRATRSERPNTRAHLGALTAGLLLPAVALLLNGWAGIDIQWQIIGTGSILLSVLALARAAGLLRTVQTQAVQLAALARSDGLTGAPNRRTWDFELSRACQVARETGDLLCVALIDLDNFKRYNDTHGHQAGDLLLREAVAIWSETLRDGDMLARYGGEEFAVLMPGRTMTDARTALDVLRRATPARQTFSAGVAVWIPRRTRPPWSRPRTRPCTTPSGRAATGCVSPTARPRTSGCPRRPSCCSPSSTWAPAPSWPWRRSAASGPRALTTSSSAPTSRGSGPSSRRPRSARRCCAARAGSSSRSTSASPP